MKQNLANRLAAGGFWALQIGWLSVEVADHLKSEGTTVPIGSGSPTEVLTVCTLGAFEHFVNVHMDDMRMNVKVKFEEPSPKLYDKYCQEITREQWAKLHQHPTYDRIALWHSDSEHRHVSTIWTGLDENHCEPPHIFETMVVHVHGQNQGHIARVFKTRNLAEARAAHHEAVALVKAGRL